MAQTNGTTHPNGSIRSKPFSLAIVGGGIGGLCLALALQSHGIPFHVYEAAAKFGEIGAGVGLGPNALRAMKMLDDEQKIFQAYKNCETSNVNPEEQKRFFNFRYGMAEPMVCRRCEKEKGEGMDRANGHGSTNGHGESQKKCIWTGGRLIADVRSDSQTSSVHRARFLDELVKLMPEGRSSFGKRLSSIEEPEQGGVVLHFEDGTEARHDAVIGCDGIKSQTRKAILGANNPTSDPVYSGKYCYRGLVPAAKARQVLGEELVENSQMYLGRGGHVITTLIEHGKTVNVVAYHAKEDGNWADAAWVRPTSREDMMSSFTGFFEPVMQTLNMVEDPVMWALFDDHHDPPAETYHRGGRICLLGDAAHASTPHHGAGAGMAVEDAMILSRLLASIEGDDGSRLAGVFAAYDTVRRPRTQRLIRSSRRCAAVYDWEDDEVGDDIEAMREYLEHAWDWIWKADLDAQLRDAEEMLARNSRRD